MRFLHDKSVPYDLTYSDVFLVPQATSINSRLSVDLTTPDGVGTTTPIVVSNMTAVAGKRMAETMARRGALAVLPQDIPLDILNQMIRSIKIANPVYETPISLTPRHTIRDALNLIYKRAHGAVIIVDENNRPQGIFTEQDADGHDVFTSLGQVNFADLICLEAGQEPSQMFDKLYTERLRVAPVVKNNKLVGIMTAKGALRATLYKPALDKAGKLMTAVAIGINGDVAKRTEAVLECGADVLVIDTAHGHQEKMVAAIKAARKAAADVHIVAGNVVTAEGTRAMIEAGANVVKVGVGPGAMCTTRMMTGVGRPQFSAVLECSAEARKLGGHVWADGGIRHPRDIALALAAGASNVMLASMFAGTYESAADMQSDNHNKLFKESFGMASNRAVKKRVQKESAFERAKKEIFEEGISSSRMYVNPETPGAEDIIDKLMAGVRSACTYAGAHNIEEFYQRAVVGIQSASGYREGKPLTTSW